MFSKLYDGNTEVTYLGIVLRKFPVHFQCWRVNFKTEECESTRFPQLTMSWINEVEMEKSIDDLMTSQSIEGRRDFPDFELLDARITSALRKIIINTSFKRRVSVEEQRAQKKNRFLRGRQIAYMIYDHFQATGADDAAQRQDDFQDFDTRWDHMSLGTSELPHENVLEGLYKMKLQGSDQLQTVVDLYNQELNRDKEAACYQTLRN